MEEREWKEGIRWQRRIDEPHSTLACFSYADLQRATREKDIVRRPRIKNLTVLHQPMSLQGSKRVVGMCVKFVSLTLKLAGDKGAA